MIQKILSGLIVLSAITLGAQGKKASGPGNPVSVTTASFQQTLVRDKKGHIRRDKNGKPVRKWVRATKVVPGTILKYVDTVTNDTNQTLTHLKVSNPINKHLLFVADSAKSDVNFSVRYSVDGGRSYAAADKLFVMTPQKKKRPAQPKDYNGIEFDIEAVPPHSQVAVEFKVKLK